MLKKSLLNETCCGLLILLFAYTGISKLLDHVRFQLVLSGSPLIHRGAGVIAWLLPVAELLIVLLLIIPSLKRTGLATSLVALVFFTVYLIYMLLFAEKLPCGCGGVLDFLSWKQHVAFNLFFIGINITAILTQQFRRKQNFLLLSIPGQESRRSRNPV